MAFYSDKLGVFRVNRRDATGEELTQFGRALSELNIDILCADTPQAKGRVERAFATLQDRLVKELRLAGISDAEAANAWLPGFVADYNERFGREPANAKDLHRPLSVQDNLDEILAWREARTVTANLVLHYDRMVLLLDPTPRARALARQQVEVVNYPDGRFAVRHEGADLPFRVFDTIAAVAPGMVVERKRLREALAHVQAQQATYPIKQRRGAPGRRRAVNNLEAPGRPSGCGRSAISTLALPHEACCSQSEIISKQLERLVNIQALVTRLRGPSREWLNTQIPPPSQRPTLTGCLQAARFVRKSLYFAQPVTSLPCADRRLSRLPSFG